MVWNGDELLVVSHLRRAQRAHGTGSVGVPSARRQRLRTLSAVSGNPVTSGYSSAVPQNPEHLVLISSTTMPPQPPAGVKKLDVMDDPVLKLGLGILGLVTVFSFKAKARTTTKGTIGCPQCGTPMFSTEHESHTTIKGQGK